MTSGGLKILLSVNSLMGLRTGIGLYTQNLIRALRRVDGIADMVGIAANGTYSGEALESLINQCGSGNLSKRRTIRSILRNVPWSYEIRQAVRERNLRGFSEEYKKAGFIFHETNFIPIIKFGSGTIVTVHDLSHCRYPEAHPRERVAWLRARLQRTLTRVERVITVSEFTRSELLEIYNLPEDKVVVCHNGVGDGFYPRSSQIVDEVLSKYGLKYKKYLLSVGTIEPRKNLDRLLSAYQTLSEDVRSEFPLVLVGVAGWKRTDLMRRLRAMEAVGDVIFTGYLSHSAVCNLYAGAAVFAYVSLYEGFGLPVIEAFASGVPVLTSDVSALPEIAGTAAIKVDPFSVEAIADGLLCLLKDNALRERYVTLGRERVRHYSWLKCAEKTSSVYRELL